MLPSRQCGQRLSARAGRRVIAQRSGSSSSSSASTCGATAGFDPKEDIRFIWTFELKVLGSNGWMRSDIETLLKMVQEKKLKVLIDKQYKLEEAREALRVIEDREVFGKIVVTP